MNAPITPPALPRSVDRLQDRLFVVAQACPFAEKNPLDCPLHDLRLAGPKHMRAWLAGLAPDEQRYLLAYHECCLAVRIETELFARPVRRPVRARATCAAVT